MFAIIKLVIFVCGCMELYDLIPTYFDYQNGETAGIEIGSLKRDLTFAIVLTLACIPQTLIKIIFRWK